jgi:hypothetical protein
MIRVVCDCGRAFKAEDRHAGKTTKCPVCGAVLTIGQPISTSSGGDDEVPSWWYPTASAGAGAGQVPGQAPRATASTQSGSDTETISTAILPPGSIPRVAPQPAATPAMGRKASAPARRLSRRQDLWALCGGAAALAILALLAILWAGSAPTLPSGNAAPEAAQPHDSHPGPNGRAPAVASQKTASPAADPMASTGAGAPGQPANRGAGEPQPTIAATQHRLHLLVPAYIYPVGAGGKEWQRLIDAASKVKIVAIANPASGPGEERNVDYSAVFAKASRHGVTLVGYVSTQYAARTWDEIRNDIDRWVQFYPQIRGFFFDQQPSEGRHAALYARIRDYARQKLRDPLLITNPGVPCDGIYLADAVSDVTCIFQNHEGFDQFEMTAALKGYEPSRFAALPYNVADAESMRALIKDAILKRIGYLYISDAKPPNQWNALPKYWEAEVDVVSHLD